MHIIKQFTKSFEEKSINELLLKLSDNMKLFEVFDDDAGYKETFYNQFIVQYVLYNLMLKLESIQITNICDINTSLVLEIFKELKNHESHAIDDSIEEVTFSNIISIPN